MDTIKGG